MLNYSSLAEAMKEKNTTQSELAKIVGKSQKTISCWCIHTRQPGVDDVAKLCAFFDLPADTVLHWFAGKGRKNRDLKSRGSSKERREIP